MIESIIMGLVSLVFILSIISIYLLDKCSIATADLWYKVLLSIGLIICLLMVIDSYNKKQDRLEAINNYEECVYE